MINSRYKKISGMHAGHVYTVQAPADEIDSPMRWSLRCETVSDERLTVSEDDLKDPKKWQALT